MREQIHRWRWLLLFLLFCVCVAFKLNGSSVGAWDSKLHDKQVATEGLLLFKPQPIRSDEWLVWTPAALSQARQTPPFPIENPSLGAGRAPLFFNLPVAYYTTFFRPQFWGFFLFDFERGFSFFWCAKIFGLLLGSAWLLRQIGVRNNFVICLGAMWMFLPLQWWFSSPTMLPEMLTTWAICSGCAIQFFTQTSRWRVAVAAAAFIYFGVNFVLCLYPPAQIPLLYLMLAMIVGVCLDQRRNGEPIHLIRGLMFSGAAVLVIALVLLPFWIDTRTTLQLISQTVYPGARRSTGGSLPFFETFSGIVTFFQTDKSVPRSYPNICEAHHSFPLWPVVLVAVIAARRFRKIDISPLFIALGSVALCLTIYCLIPFPPWLARWTLLSFAPEFRVVFGIGIANIFLTCLFLDRYRELVFPKSFAVSATVGFCLAIATLLWSASFRQPGFFPDHRQVVLSFFAGATVIALFFWERRRAWLPVLLIVLMFVTDIGVNPVMSGLAPLLRSEAFKAIDEIRAADPAAKWLVYYNSDFPELVRATGADVINATKVVPDLPFLRRIDPLGQGNSVYNRYAHISCLLPPNSPDEIGFFLMQPDIYVMELSPTMSILRDIGCRYVVFPQDWQNAGADGFSLIKVVADNKIWIYRRQ